MTNKTYPGTGEQKTYTVYSEHMLKIQEDRKYFRLVPLLCLRNGCEGPGESSGPV